MVYIADTFGAEPADGVTVSTRTVAPDDLKQRRGWFQVDMNFKRSMPPEDLAALFAGFIPYRVESRFDRADTLYWGCHPDFAPSAEGTLIPEYEPVFHRGANTGALTVEWRPVEGEWHWIPQRREGE